MNTALAWLAALLLGSCLIGSNATSSASSARADRDERVGRLHLQFEYDSFRRYGPAARPIDFESIDHDLLAAAVFHETNRQRARHRRAALGYRPELLEAARLQAQSMARTGTISHRHRDRRLRTVTDRLERAGLQPAFAAENVAMTFGIRYEAGRAVYRRQESGAILFSYRPDGAPIEPHTYLSFAEDLVGQWMASASHRENILHPQAAEMGSAHEHARNEQGMDTFYSAQVFFQELKANRRPRQR